MPKPMRRTPPAATPKPSPPPARAAAPAKKAAPSRREATQELNRRILAEVQRRNLGPSLTQAEKLVVAKAVGVPGASDAAKRQRVWSALRVLPSAAKAFVEGSSRSRRASARAAAAAAKAPAPAVKEWLPEPANVDVAVGVNVQDFERFLAATLRITRAVKSDHEATEALGELLASLRFVTTHTLRGEL